MKDRSCPHSPRTTTVFHQNAATRNQYLGGAYRYNLNDMDLIMAAMMILSQKLALAI